MRKVNERDAHSAGVPVEVEHVEARVLSSGCHLIAEPQLLPIRRSSRGLYRLYRCPFDQSSFIKPKSCCGYRLQLGQIVFSHSGSHRTPRRFGYRPVGRYRDQLDDHNDLRRAHIHPCRNEDSTSFSAGYQAPASLKQIRPARKCHAKCSRPPPMYALG